VPETNATCGCTLISNQSSTKAMLNGNILYKWVLNDGGFPLNSDLFVKQRRTHANKHHHDLAKKICIQLL
jgi:hypothetical protein